MLRALVPTALVAIAGCAASEPPTRHPPEPIARAEPPPAATAASADAPEISRSAGSAGGVVVLWPRIVLPRGSSGPDAETRAIAGEVQRELETLARRAAPGAEVDARPEPERVCPRSGCRAASLGVLLARAGSGCAVLALVSKPGTSAQRIVPWYGQVRLDADQVPFREHAERKVHVEDYGSCSALPGALAERRSAIEEAIRHALDG